MIQFIELIQCAYYRNKFKFISLYLDEEKKTLQQPILIPHYNVTLNIATLYTWIFFLNKTLIYSVGVYTLTILYGRYKYIETYLNIKLEQNRKKGNPFLISVSSTFQIFWYLMQKKNTPSEKRRRIWHNYIDTIFIFE